MMILSRTNINRLWRQGLFVLLLLAAGAAAGCADKGIDTGDKGSGRPGSGNDEDPLDSFGIEIALDNLSGSISTRSFCESAEEFEEWENYIDVMDPYRFRVLVFNTANKFLFEANRVSGSSVIPVTQNIFPFYRKWIVRVPLKKLDSDSYDAIMNNGFKVAVLANWPANQPFNLAPGDDLGNLSHYILDNFYNETDAYDHLTYNGLMGAYQNWVKNFFENVAEAEDCIRNGIRPNPFDFTRDDADEGGRGRTHTYKDIWRVWNFNNGATVPYNTDNNQSVLTELTRNEEWLAQAQAGESFTTKTDGTGLEFVKITNTAFSNGAIQIPTSVSAENQANGTQVTSGYFHFRIYADGTLHIKARCPGNGTVGLHVGTMNGNSTDGRTKNIDSRKTALTSEPLASNPNITDYTADLEVTGSPVDVYVYAVGGTVHFYELEFIESRYLSDTDRHGLMPGPDQLIPMYGVQEYGPIGPYMLDDSMFNISSDNGHHNPDYDYKQIYLLRSIAKVEVWIPQEWENAVQHIYMRSMNRYSRCEPLDVYTPTELLWNDVDREILNIQEYGPFYDTSKAGDYLAFRNRIAWFYGAWLYNPDGSETAYWNTAMSWNWNNDSEIELGNEDAANFPHIYNCRISRSDYTRFTEIAPQDGFRRYVLYMPEKNIDDTNDRGDMGSTPKVPHVEIRFDGLNDEANLDDSGCYRIYFTQGGKTPGTWGRDDYENSDKKYESSIENLKKHYPVMRNHIYRFKVTRLNGSDVDFQICTPAQRTVTIPEFN